MLTRDFDFLRQKYREMLLPTLLMLLSDKICLIADIAVIGFFLTDSSFLSAINLVSPFIYFSAVIYTLFGVGGSLLALRAKANYDDEKANYYFTAALRGMLLANVIYIAFSLTIGNDLALILFDVPPEIFNTFLLYQNTLVFYFPFLCYILTLGYFARSDGYPNLPFISLLIANISNIAISIILMGVYHFGVEGSALGTVIGYAIGSVYISKYFLMENRDFFLTTRISLRQSATTIIEFLKNTPEIITRIFLTAKVMFLTIMCSEYLGIAGIMAFMVYDNSETMVYMFLSAIAKVMSPIVAVFYKEKDYEAVEYILKTSLKQVLIISIPVSLLFALWPELFTYIFTLDDPSEAYVICTALRITSVGLIGRCVSLLLSSYTQAIEENRISSIMNLSEELIVAFGGAIVLAKIFGPIGIWYSIVLADLVPVIIYLIFALRYQFENADKIRALLLLQQSNTVTWTYERGIEDIDHYVDAEKKEFLLELEEMLKEKSPQAISSIDEIVENILRDEEIKNIDVTLRYLDDCVTITLTYGGKLANPISDSNMERMKEIGGDLEYSPILGFNRSYINVDL